MLVVENNPYFLRKLISNVPNLETKILSHANTVSAAEAKANLDSCFWCLKWFFVCLYFNSTDEATSLDILVSDIDQTCTVSFVASNSLKYFMEKTAQVTKVPVSSQYWFEVSESTAISRLVSDLNLAAKHEDIGMQTLGQYQIAINNGLTVGVSYLTGSNPV